MRVKVSATHDDRAIRPVMNWGELLPMQRSRSRRGVAAMVLGAALVAIAQGTTSATTVPGTEPPSTEPAGTEPAGTEPAGTDRRDRWPAAKSSQCGYRPERRHRRRPLRVRRHDTAAARSRPTSSSGFAVSILRCRTSTTPARPTTPSIIIALAIEIAQADGIEHRQRDHRCHPRRHEVHVVRRVPRSRRRR